VIKDENFYVVQGWMINKLNLKSTELQIFAMIYGFTQDGKSEFKGSLSYIQDWTGVSRPTVIATLNSLINKGLIIKTTFENGETNSYRVAGSKESLLGGSKESLLGGSKESLLGGSKESLHYNNTDNNINKDRVSANPPSSSSAETSSSETPHSSSGASHSKPTSGKLISSPKTRKSVTQKVNSFIRMCEKETALKGYPVALQRELQKFFIMLGESNTLLPQTTIKEQLAALDKLSADKRVEAVTGTLQHGWKSLVYMCDELSGKNKKKNDPAFIGNSQPKAIDAPRISRDEQLRRAVANGEEVF